MRFEINKNGSGNNKNERTKEMLMNAVLIKLLAVLDGKGIIEPKDFEIDTDDINADKSFAQVVPYLDEIMKK